MLQPGLQICRFMFVAVKIHAKLYDQISPLIYSNLIPSSPDNRKTFISDGELCILNVSVNMCFINFKLNYAFHIDLCFESTIFRTLC